MGTAVECWDRRERDAITPKDIERCRRRIKIGDRFRILDKRWSKGTERHQLEPPIVMGRVTGKYRHLVTLDCGTSITYAEIMQARCLARKVIV